MNRNFVRTWLWPIAAIAALAAGCGTSTADVTAESSGELTTTVTGISSGVSWTYLDTGATPPSNWNTAAFTASGWKTGASPLGYGNGAVALWIGIAERPITADAKSGLHFCFDAPSRKSVDAFHSGALGAGGRDNGKPGIRADYDPNYYAAFVVDPDGYRIEAYCGKKA